MTIFQFFTLLVLTTIIFFVYKLRGMLYIIYVGLFAKRYRYEIRSTWKTMRQYAENEHMIRADYRAGRIPYEIYEHYITLNRKEQLKLETTLFRYIEMEIQYKENQQ